METNENKKVFGVYQNEADAQRAVDELLKIGYTQDQISVLSKSGETVNAEDTETATETGLIGGAATGAALGGVGGLLASLGLLAIPGIGPILAAGPIAAAVAGAIAGGTVGGTVGTLGGILFDSGADEEDVRYADERFHAGDIIVHVDAEPRHFERVSNTLGYRRWDPNYNPVQKADLTAGFNPDSKTINTVYQGDSDLRHDNRDLDKTIWNEDVNLKAEPPKAPAPPVVEPVQGEVVYTTDSDLRHDNLDLDEDRK